MRLLLDTHALLWWLDDNPRLSTAARNAIAERANVIFASAVSAYEISYKFLSGRLPDAARVAQNFDGVMEDEGFATLALASMHAQAAGLLDIPHRDPFDRMLIAQAQIEGLTLVSNESLFDKFGVRRLW